MRIAIFVTSALALSACGTTSYGPYGVNRGYIGGRTEPGVYQVAGNTTPRTRSGFAAEMALYRAAELAKQDGFRFIQIVYFHNGALHYGSAAGGMIMTGTSGERSVVRVRGVDSLSAPIRCEIPDTSQCRNLDVDEVAAQLGPRIRAPGHK